MAIYCMCIVLLACDITYTCTMHVKQDFFLLYMQGESCSEAADGYVHSGCQGNGIPCKHEGGT